MKFLIVIFTLISTFGFGQNYVIDHFGGSLGIVFNVGSHVNSIGLNAKGYYTDHFYQINGSSTIYLNYSSYGGRRKFIETRNAVGAILLAGKKERDIDFQLDGLNHNTSYNLGVGFNYIFYHDNAGTSQKSGGFALHVKEFSIYHENDVFGGLSKDRFRTAHLFLSYQYKDFKLGTGVNLWTGETKNAPWQRLSFDKCPNGFRLLEDLPYGRTSHGIFYGSVQFNGPFNQITQLKIGVDSESIRHGFQNRLIHDLLFLPKKIKRTTPHYPRLDAYGCPVFDKESARANKLYLQWGLNDNWAN